MSAATSTSLGEIVLAGDFAGDANFPMLCASGVTPGHYVARKIYVDAKGRITWISPTPGQDLLDLLPNSTTGVNGVFQLGEGFYSSGGELSATTASSSAKGIFSFGAGMGVSAGTAVLDTSALLCSSTVFGLTKAGTNIDNTSGVLSVAEGSVTAKGVASFSTGLSVSGGYVSISAPAKFNIANTFTKAQCGGVDHSSVTSITPNFQSGSSVQHITLSGNLTINFPTTLAPTGTCVTQTIVIEYSASTPYTVTASSSYLKNRTLSFANTTTTALDVLTLICTDSVCYAMLNEQFQ